MQITVVIDAEDGDTKLFEDFLRLYDRLKSSTKEEPGIERYSGIQVPMSLGFNWVDCPKRGFRVPQLATVWVKGYGWILNTGQDVEVKVRRTVLVPNDIGRAILGDSYTQHGLLPVRHR